MLVGLGLAAVPAGGSSARPAEAAKPKLKIQVLSNRADLLSGGDALVRIKGPTKGVRVKLGKRTVTETQTVTETVGREVLDVNKTGEVQLTDGQTMTDADRKRNNR